MTNERDERLLDLLDAALALKPSQWAKYLDEACKGDVELRREVKKLLDFADDADDLLRVDENNADPATVAQATSGTSSGQLGSGSRLGDFTIVKQIGAGGLASLGVAERIEIVRKTSVTCARSFGVFRFIRRPRSWVCCRKKRKSPKKVGLGCVRNSAPSISSAARISLLQVGCFFRLLSFISATTILGLLPNETKEFEKGWAWLCEGFCSQHLECDKNQPPARGLLLSASFVFFGNHDLGFVAERNERVRKRLGLAL